MVELQIKDKRGNIIKYQLGDGRHLLGKSRVCDILLMDHFVSRRHAELLVVDDAVYLFDRNSTNGTWVGNKKTSGVIRLGYDSLVRLGWLEMSIHPLLYEFSVRTGHACKLNEFGKNGAAENSLNVHQLHQPEGNKKSKVLKKKIRN